jgi:DNA recombination-dependent growth factor C
MFIAASSSFTRYRIIEPVPDTLWPEITDRLRRNAIRDIDESLDERSFGWVCFDNMLDTQWTTAPPEKAGYLAFSLRLDTRRVPAAVFKKHFQIAMERAVQQLKQEGRKGLSRDHKRELKDTVMSKLMSRTLPIPAVFNVVWNIADGVIWFDSTRSKVCELFTEHFTLSFDLHLEPLTPFFMALSHVGESRLAQLEALEPARFA